LVGQGVEPVEGLEDLGRAEAGLGEFGEERAVLEGVAVADRWRVSLVK
jgi:hypothetical protein